MGLFRNLTLGGALVCALAAYPLGCIAQTRLWGTFYGGEKAEEAGKVITDSSGNIFVIGTTASTTGIFKGNAFDAVLTEPQQKAYLAKFDTAGSLVWATYYGDGVNTAGIDLGLDAAGNIYVTGNVTCPSMKLGTTGSHDVLCEGGKEIFLAKFNPQGVRQWGTYFGGPGEDTTAAISVSSVGYVYLAGTTKSAQGIVPLNGPDPTWGGNNDAVLAKFSPTGNLMWGRYFGSVGEDLGFDIACKAAAFTAPDQCYVTGSTSSAAGIAEGTSIYDSVLSGNRDAFLAKINGTTGQTLWSTYYGGNNNENDTRVAVDKNLNVFLGGYTTSDDGSMAPANAYDPSYNGNVDIFLARFNADGARQAATYYGNFSEDWLLDLATDTNSNVYLVGRASSQGDHVTGNAYDGILDGPYDVVLTKFNQVLVRLWGTYYGGNAWEQPGGVAIGVDGHVHLYGHSTSQDGTIATPGAHKVANTVKDAFLVEFSQ